MMYGCSTLGHHLLEIGSLEDFSKESVATNILCLQLFGSQHHGIASSDLKRAFS
jgi:hypothetical protein